MAGAIKNLDLGAGIQELLAKGKILSKCQAEHSQGKWGTSVSGLAAPPEGVEFHCKDCIHEEQDATRCDKKEVMDDPQAKKDENGLAIIEPAWCCTFWWPKDVKDNQLPQGGK